ncbi:AraC family transcriptional regulator ligand-binding domain-containing protein [Acinetobacter sp. XH1639]|uniref:AraC family transcriptional regulator ligand-binding domain-containing protein n=1 Tax=Acinetobacter sp. XH1639 TaxID=3157368 RepID=UPI0032B33949
MKTQTQLTSQIKIFGIFPGECLRYAEELGADVSPILKINGFSSIDEVIETNIDFSVMQKIMTEIWRILPNESIGFIAGIRIPPTAYGSLGQAILSCANFNDAVSIILQYWDLIGRGISLDVKINDQQCSIRINTEFAVQPFLERWMIESSIAAVWRFLSIVMPTEKQKVHVFFKFPSPVHLKSVESYISNITYGFPITELVFPIGLLEKPFDLYSSIGLQHAIQQCDIQLKKLTQIHLLSEQVKIQLGISANGYPNIEQISEILSISPRTLRKKLHAESKKYSVLVQEAKLLDAIDLLKNPNFN